VELVEGEAMADFSFAEFEGCIEKAKLRAQVDPLFRTLALNDAKEALRKIRGASLPDDLTVVFVEPGASAFKDPAHTRVVVLDSSAEVAEELSDDDLENVAGGGDGTGTGMTGGW